MTDGEKINWVVKEIASISKKLHAITKDNIGIKEDVKEITRFLTESDFTLVNDQATHGAPPSMYLQSSESSHTSYQQHQNYPLYEEPTDTWSPWEYSPNRSFGYSPLSTPRRTIMTPRCDMGLPQGSPLTRSHPPVTGQRFNHGYASFTEVPPRTTHRPLVSTASSNHFSARLLAEIKETSNSRYNFAVNLVRHAFDEDIRKKSNVAGKCNKQRLDPEKMAQIKEATFQMYPCADGESKLFEWKKCHRAIDESCRRLNRETKVMV